MDITKISDLELAKVLSEQKDLLTQVSNNVRALQEELEKRLKAAKEKPKYGEDSHD